MRDLGAPLGANDSYERGAPFCKHAPKSQQCQNLKNRHPSLDPTSRTPKKQIFSLNDNPTNTQKSPNDPNPKSYIPNILNPKTYIPDNPNPKTYIPNEPIPEPMSQITPTPELVFQITPIPIPNPIPSILDSVFRSKLVTRYIYIYTYTCICLWTCLMND